MKTSLSCKGCLSVCQPKPDKYCIPLHFNDLCLTLCKTLAEHALKRALLIFLGKASSSRQLRPMSQSNASMAYACQNLCQTQAKLLHHSNREPCTSSDVPSVHVPFQEGSEQRILCSALQYGALRQGHIRSLASWGCAVCSAWICNSLNGTPVVLSLMGSSQQVH